MLEWLAENSALLQIGVAIVSAIIWLIYLQVFLMNYLRQRRPEILISRGAGVGMEARCYVANLGLEPMYISQMLITVKTADSTCHAAITDREALTEEQMHDPRQATNQGPLKSGDSYDAGSFDELVRRGLRACNENEDADVLSFELTVVALHAASASFIGAIRKFDVIERSDRVEILPDDISTRQVRSFLARWRLKRKLRRDLSWYRS